MSSFLVDAISDEEPDKIADLISRGANPFLGYTETAPGEWITPVWWLIENTSRSMLPHVIGTNLTEVPLGSDCFGRDGGTPWNLITGLAYVDPGKVDISRTIDSVRRCMEKDSPAFSQALQELTKALLAPGAADQDFYAGKRLVQAVIGGATPLNGDWTSLMNAPIRIDAPLDGIAAAPTQIPLLQFLLWVQRDREIAPALSNALRESYDPNTYFAGVPLLHLAAGGNHVACVEALISAGADVTTVCDSETGIATHDFKKKMATGMTVLEFAKAVGANSVVPLLEAAVAKSAIDRVISTARSPQPSP